MTASIRTRAPFALMASSNGLKLDAYDTWLELTEQALYLHATNAHRDEENSVPKPEDFDQARICDYYLRRMEYAVVAVRRRVIETFDPKRLRADEVWPWHDETCGCEILPDHWYGFSDSGGLIGGFAGYVCAADAIDAISLEVEVPMDDACYSTKPEDLGDVACCVLSGRQYVDRLYELCAPGGGWDLSDYGHWSEPPVEEKHAPATERVLQVLRDNGYNYGRDAVERVRLGVELALAGKFGGLPAEKHASGLTAEQEASIHKKLAACPQVSKKTQGYVMGILREVLRPDGNNV